MKKYVEKKNKYEIYKEKSIKSFFFKEIITNNEYNNKDNFEFVYRIKTKKIEIFYFRLVQLSKMF